ncbi:MAG TPA: protein translocase subunit SecF [Sandaracinaceae bacterium LLY-WYZ-13_1]|nr:protein translocase subunit SecF [Sandaracinaceae bacterium LLY-WYZ-13_1]
MEFFKPGLVIDFMRHRRVYMVVSAVLVVASIVAVFLPGPNYGTDFVGGTEIQVGFEQPVTTNELRGALETLGYEGADVVAVVEQENQYIIRVRAFSAIGDEQRDQIRGAVLSAVEGVEGVSVRNDRVRIPEGGDAVRMELTGAIDESVIQEALEQTGVSVLRVTTVGAAGSHVYEAQLEGVAQEILQGLDQELGANAPLTPERIERVGPRAGAQLRDAAIKSLAYAIMFIMVYVAFRFDLRFAPGGVVAMAHDAMITVGIFILLQKEFNLTIVAALLTIVGYSINDTIVVYDRIRENLGRYRDKSLYDVINISTSQMLSRTIVTSSTTLLSVSAFFIWGTSVVRDISFALFIGILIGTYSSIYVAAPLTEWMDRRFFSKAKARAKRQRAKQRAKA